MQARRQRQVRMVVRMESAGGGDRDAIYGMRHDVYAVELGQHGINESRRLSDALDAHNRYLVAEADGRMVGFISLTPPSAPSYSVEKYLKRAEIPARFDDGLWEVRILTVAREHRRGPAALMLMRAALNAIRESGGRSVLVMGRREVTAMYARIGLSGTGIRFMSGACEYEVMVASVEDIERASVRRPETLKRIEGALGKKTEGSKTKGAGEQQPKAPCDHGGAFFAAVGARFDDLSRRHRVVSADVLDAWFPPAPGVMEAIHEHLPWMLTTSPPTHAEGLVEAIAASRGVETSNIAVGGGSSALIFLAMRHWLTRASRVLVLDPMYAEYDHVLERVVGCRVDRLKLRAEDGFVLPRDEMRRALASGEYDLVAMVNPNNPTGVHVPREEMEWMVRSAHARTRVWIDEAYIEYVGSRESMERFAARSANTVVCKSLSKGYALSGARAAYIVACEGIAAELRRITPPWSVSLPAQVAGVRALADGGYYAGRYAQTHELRRDMVRSLKAMARWHIHEGAINCVLCLLGGGVPGAAEIVQRCREEGVFVRHCATISPSLGDRAVRVSVKDRETNARVLAALERAVRGARRVD